MQTTLAYTIFLLSGIAGLGYQMAWTRALALGLGHEMPALLAIVSAFFGGLALGAWALDRRIASSPAPHRIYAALELLIGGWAVVTALLLGEINTLALDLQGTQPGALRQFVACFTVPFLALLPATTAMGATLAAMDRTMHLLTQRPGRLAGVYAANTAGAVAGTLLGTYLLAPALGYRGTLLALAAVNAACAAVALALRPAQMPRWSVPTASHTPPAAPSRSVRRVLFVTGLLGIGVEVVAVRVLAQVFEATVYSFAAALSVYLLGTAFGAAIYQSLRGGRHGPGIGPGLLLGLAASCVATLWTLAHAMEIYRAARLWLGDSPAGVLGAEAAVAAAVLALPTMLMGATFCHFAQRMRGPRGGIGMALAVNTTGAALAPLVFGAALLPTVGAHAALACTAAGYAALGLALLPPGRRWRLAPVLLLPLVALPADLRIVTLRPGEAVLDHREGAMASVSVVASARERNLRVDNRFQMGGTGPEALRLQRRQAHLPLLLHRAPDTALFLGVASGVTVGAALAHSELAVDAAEIVPEVLSALALFEPENGAPQRHPRARLHAADARRFVRGIDRRYDVIVSDLFHPGRDGAGALYTVEHFRAVRARLAPGGTFWQWLPLYQLDLDGLALITRSFLAAFPQATAFLVDANARFPALALVGTEHPLRLEPAAMNDRLRDQALRGTLRAIGLGAEVDVLGMALFDRADLVALAGTGPLNTDDRPLMIYRAPRFSALRGQPSHGRLLPLLDRAGSWRPQTLLAEDCDADKRDLCARVLAYTTARDRFLRASVDHITRGREAAVAGYLVSLRASGEFEPPRNALLRIAMGRAQTDPAAALDIVQAVVQARPDDLEARALRDRLLPTSPPAR